MDEYKSLKKFNVQQKDTNEKIKIPKIQNSILALHLFNYIKKGEK